MKSSLPNARRGFTLVEVALAIVIVSIVILAAIGLLLPAQRAIDDVLSGGQATRLRQEIEKEFSALRRPENKIHGGPYSTAFDKAYDGVRKSVSPSELWLAFFYRAVNPAKNQKTTESGRLAPYIDDVKEKRPGEDYVVQAAFMSLREFRGDPPYRDEKFLDALEGRLFVVKLVPLEGLVSETQIPTSEKTLKPLPAYNGSGTPLATFLRSNSSDAYPLAVIPVAAEFYEASDVDNPTIAFDANANPKNAQIRPVISLNIGFNR
jgi:prepilin-type N-terminal cleavage/methylation domain-containing protein